MNKPSTVDEYIAGFDPKTAAELQKIRETIRKAAPGAQEVISYGMPAYKQNGILVWFAANKNHFGLYPKAAVIDVFSEKLADYHCSKGTIQFPFSKPVPHDLIVEIVRYRVKENTLGKKSIDD